MKVTHLSYSSSGGAGNVAANLNYYFTKSAIIESSFTTITRTNIKKNPMQNIKLSLTALYDNHVVKQNEFDPLFSLYRRGVSFDNLVIENSDLLHFHWMAGIIGSEFQRKIKQKNIPVVWTLHDMEPYTGGCHYSLQCNNFLDGCMDCPAVRENFKSKVNRNMINKLEFMNSISRIALVSPANWGKTKISKIEELAQHKIHVIPNPVDEIFFGDIDYEMARAKNGISKDNFVIGFVSDQVNNPLKNFKEFIQIVEKINNTTSRNLTLLVIGDYRKKIKLINNISIIYTGRINQRAELKSLYACMDIMISSSLAETFGLTVAEASAVGTPTIVKRGVAACELLIDGVTGFTYSDANQGATQVSNLLSSNSQLAQMKIAAKNHAKEKWEINVIARQYYDLYLSMM